MNKLNKKQYQTINIMLSFDKMRHLDMLRTSETISFFGDKWDDFFFKHKHRKCCLKISRQQTARIFFNTYFFQEKKQACQVPGHLAPLFFFLKKICIEKYIAFSFKQ